jgi:peptidoglycan/xylan/chitin deacetylase (PgdA/CDA1 family)
MEVYDIVAPILLKKGVPACFFIASAFIDNKEMCYDHKKSVLAEAVNKGLSSETESEIKRVLESFGKYSNGIYESILRIKYDEKHYLNRLAAVIGIDFHQYLQRIEPYLKSDSISKLIQLGFGIGAHSIDHPLYSNLSLEEQLRQTIESVIKIRETFGINYGAFAFPLSDAGVKAKFFETLSASGLVDVSFGGGGFVNDEVRTNFQRLSFENPPLPAERLVKVEVTRKLSRFVTGKGTIKR